MADERVILCFGDSNTHGTMAMSDHDSMDRYPRGQRWPDVMAAALGPGWVVLAEGHPGRTTVHDDPLEGGHRSGTQALPVLLDTHRPIDLVVILLGTNDLKARFSMTPGDVSRGIEQLLLIIAASSAGPGGAAPRALVVSPAPISEVGFLAEMFHGGAAKSRALAASLADVADRYGAAFWDAGEVGAVDAGEGIHLTLHAQQAIGTALAEKLRGVFSVAGME